MIVGEIVLKTFFLCVVMLAFFAVGVIGVPYFIISENNTGKYYSENGETVICTVVKAERSFRTKAQSVTVAFEDDNGNVISARLKNAGITAYSEGDSVEVYVLPDDTADVWLINEPKSSRLVKYVIYGILFLLGVSMPFIAAFTIYENKLINAAGKDVTGVIINVRINGNGYKIADIMFPTENGDVIERDISVKKYHRSGDNVAITYAYSGRGKLHWRFK